MINTHATECRVALSRIGAVSDDYEPERTMQYRSLALEYAAKCDALEALVRRTREGLELVA